MNAYLNSYRIVITAIFVLSLAGCIHAHDAVDMAYQTYVNQRDSCSGIANEHQRDACMMRAVGQLSGSLDNIANRSEKWQPPDASGTTPPAPQPTKSIELFPQEPPTPSLPGPGPTVEALEAQRVTPSTQTTEKTKKSDSEAIAEDPTPEGDEETPSEY